jgi:hypothetical protein
MGDYFAILSSRVRGAPDSVRPVLPARFEPELSPAVKELPQPEETLANAPGTTGTIEVIEEIPAPVLRLQLHRPPNTQVLLDEAGQSGHGISSAVPSVPQSVPALQQPTAPRLDRSFPSHPEELPAQVVRPPPNHGARAPDAFQQPMSNPAFPPEAQPSVWPISRSRPAVSNATAIDTSPPDRSATPIRRPSRLHLEDETRPAAKRGAITDDQRAEQELRPTFEQKAATQPFPIGPTSALSDFPYPQASEHPAARPPIRITIGRIEVHAMLPTTSPSRPSPRPPSGPALSLDDYLKQRNCVA